MPEVLYGGKHGTSFRFETVYDSLVVRTRSGRPFRRGPVLPAEATLIADMELLFEFPEVGVQVFRSPDIYNAVKLENLQEKLERFSDIRFAGHLLVDERSAEPVVYTENIFIKFEDDAKQENCIKFLQTEGLLVKRTLHYAPNAFFVSTPEGTGRRVFDIALRLLQRQDVEFSHPELVRRLEHKTIYPQQWHLQSTTIDGQQVRASSNVDAAHALTQGEGVTIAIIDDGFELEHEEFSDPGKIVAPWDVTLKTEDVRPRAPVSHGTACAGVACADGRFGASGVAPKARLMPIRLYSALGSQPGRGYD